jgi:hypothetical protein
LARVVFENAKIKKDVFENAKIKKDVFENKLPVKYHFERLRDDAGRGPPPWL